MTDDPVDASTDLTRLVASLADNKYFLGRRYAEWCTAAPALEAAVAAAAMAQDEIGHARSLYPLLRDLAGASPEVEPETRIGFTNARFLDRPFESWMDFVAANFLFDTALSVMLAACRSSSSSPLAQRANRILEEERLHWLHGEGWTRRLASDGGAVARSLATSMRVVNPESLACFDIASGALVDEGVLDAPGDELRQRFNSRVMPVLNAAGLALA